MRQKLTATALSLVLCSGTQMAQLALAAAPSAIAGSQVIKTTITQDHSQVDLTMGKATVIRLSKPASRVSISNPETVGIVLISPTEVQLIGKAVGVANLLVWSEDSGSNYLTIDLTVHKDVSALANKIQLIDPGINIVPVPAEDSVILTGVAESIERAQLAYDLAKAFFGDNPTVGTSHSQGTASIVGTSTKIINLIRVMGQPTTKAEMVQEQLKEIDPNIKLNVVPGFGGKEKAILTGRVRNASMVSKAINFASIFYGAPGIKVLADPGGNVAREGAAPTTGSSAQGGNALIGSLSSNVLYGSLITDSSGNVVSMLEVEERPQIRCSIKFLEVQKSRIIATNASSRGLGNDIRFSTYAGRHGVANVNGQAGTLLTDINTFFGQVNGNSLSELSVRYGREFASIISGLVTTGRARILAEPTITSISGEPASFLAGGEFPIPLVTTNGGLSVVFREFGIRMNILATVTERGTIHMQVSPEVSSLDTAAGVPLGGGIVPGLRTRRSQTVLEMKDGENFVISGLFSDDFANTLQKTPILGQIPILGDLFRSRDYQKRQTEMVIVIHPEIINDMNLSNLPQRPMIGQAQQQLQQMSAEEILKAYNIDPEKVKQMAGVPQQPAAEKPATAETIAAQNSTEQLQPLPDKEKTKASLKEIRKTQKKMSQLSQDIARGNVADAKPETSIASHREKPTGEKVPQTASAETTQPSVYMAQSNPLANTVQQSLEPVRDYLKEQGEALARLIGDLEQPVLSPALEINKAPSEEPSPASAVPAPPDVIATPVTAPITESKPQQQPSRETQKARPQVTSDTEEASDEQGTETKKPAVVDKAKSKPVLKKAAAPKAGKSPKIPYRTRRMVESNVKRLQKQLSQLLSFNKF